MKVLAWVVLVLVGLSVLFQPMLFGTPRKPSHYSCETWVGAVIEFACYLPLCGRVLGWW